MDVHGGAVNSVLLFGAAGELAAKLHSSWGVGGARRRHGEIWYGRHNHNSRMCVKAGDARDNFAVKVEGKGIEIHCRTFEALTWDEIVELKKTGFWKGYRVTVLDKRFGG